MSFDDDASCSVGEVKVVAETELAIKVASQDDSESYWVPKSMVHDDSEVWKMGDDGALVVKEWFAEKEGLV